MLVSSLDKNRLVSFAIAVGFALTVGSAASARTITLRWDHPNPSSVVGFRAHWGSASRAAQPYDSSTELGKPASSSGVYSASIDVPDYTVYVALTAYDSTGESSFSNEQVRVGSAPPPPPAEPPPPPPPSPPPPSPPAEPEASAAILGFRLWDAASDSVIDSDFRTGETISLDTMGDCVAIEVLGNGYLASFGAPGSVKYAFDGNEPSSCSDPGSTHENNPPYAWELDEGPNQFACAPSLTQPGSHTLTVTPFDGDNCTGLAGGAVTIGFEVVAPSPPPPASAPSLGQPGQPVVVQ